MKCFDIELTPGGAILTGYLQQSSAEMPNMERRPGILILPGGAYAFCSDREAEPIALAYMAAGYNAFVLRYSTNEPEVFPKALADGEAAMAYLRAHTEEFGLRPGKLAMVGFSAGGHLAACLGTLSAQKPDALVLVYPCILAEMGEVLHQPMPSANEAVTAATPPTFLCAARGDETVPVRNTLAFADALEKAGVVFEEHIFLTGRHGFSLAQPSTSKGIPELEDENDAQWLSMSLRFLQTVLAL